MAQNIKGGKDHGNDPSYGSHAVIKSGPESAQQGGLVTNMIINTENSQNDYDNNLWMTSPWVTFNEAADWKNILVHGKRIILPKGKVIVAAGSLVPKLHYLHRGEIVMRSFDHEGREKIIWYIEEGCIFGEVPFFLRCSLSF